MNELKNIINLFNDVDLPLYANIEQNYAETNCASLQCLYEFINVESLIHRDYCMYINYDEDTVIFDRKGLEYLNYWR